MSVAENPFISLLVSRDFLVSFITAAFFAGAGALWSPLLSRYRNRRIAKFWRPFLEGRRVTVVLGVHREFEVYEPSGFIGAGDSLALTEIQSIDQGARNGWVDTLNDSDIKISVLLGKSVIALGGPDANSLTQKVVKRITSTYEFGEPQDHEIGFLDNTDGQVYNPSILPDDPLNGVDYGVIIRAPNPLDESAGGTVLVVAGSYGYGTWAGATLLSDQRFLGHELVAGKSSFECLFRVEVIDGYIGTPHIIGLRPLT